MEVWQGVDERVSASEASPGRHEHGDVTLAPPVGGRDRQAK